ncbi:hypothetical protein C8Q77DRAFT_1070086 [Trametes polyzona]|nr:hypothetical protein C8Q77DRAFT_1070086 [Trametes polyzona]
MSEAILDLEDKLYTQSCDLPAAAERALDVEIQAEYVALKSHLLGTPSEPPAVFSILRSPDKWIPQFSNWNPAPAHESASAASQASSALTSLPSSSPPASRRGGASASTTTSPLKASGRPSSALSYATVPSANSSSGDEYDPNVGSSPVKKGKGRKKPARRGTKATRGRRKALVDVGTNSRPQAGPSTSARRGSEVIVISSDSESESD